MSLEQIGRVLALPADACSAPARHVLTVLAWYADVDGRRAWPSVATLTRQTGLARRTVQTALGDLRAAGLAAIDQPAVGQSAAVYRLTLPAQEPHPRISDTGAGAAQGGRTTSADPRTTSAEGRRSRTQSVLNRPEPQNAGARDAANGAHPRGNSTGAPPAPVLPPLPPADSEGVQRVLRELAERKRMRTGKPADSSDHGEPDPSGIPH